VPGVQHATLWRADPDRSGLLWLAADAVIPAHEHAAAAHHMWVLEGEAVADGHELPAGSYCYIPPGCTHELRGGRAAGCTVLYVFLRAVQD
jgi:quercetin dioxygenase-like cupin family protein